MRSRFTISFALFSFSLAAQTISTSAFPSQLITKYSQLASVHSVTLNGNASWIAGSSHESGTVTLSASSDGSTTFDLSMGRDSRRESASALGTSRVCHWIDARSNAHEVTGPDCDLSVPWFAPLVLAQPTAAVSRLLIITDDGTVTRANSAYHQISYRTIEPARDAATSQALAEDTRVRVLYDPQTLVPASAEFSIHADNNLSRQIPVRIVYSNYQAVSGIPVPFQIDRYVNGVLQLSLTLTNASSN